MEDGDSQSTIEGNTRAEVFKKCPTVCTMSKGPNEQRLKGIHNYVFCVFLPLYSMHTGFETFLPDFLSFSFALSCSNSLHTPPKLLVSNENYSFFQITHMTSCIYCHFQQLAYFKSTCVLLCSIGEQMSVNAALHKSHDQHYFHIEMCFVGGLSSGTQVLLINSTLRGGMGLSQVLCHCIRISACRPYIGGKGGMKIPNFYIYYWKIPEILLFIFGWSLNIIDSMAKSPAPAFFPPVILLQ